MAGSRHRQVADLVACRASEHPASTSSVDAQQRDPQRCAAGAPERLGDLQTHDEPLSRSFTTHRGVSPSDRVVRGRVGCRPICAGRAVAVRGGCAWHKLPRDATPAGPPTSTAPPRRPCTRPRARSSWPPSTGGTPTRDGCTARPRRTAAARQRAGGDGRRARRAAGRGDLHPERHPRRPPGAARAAARARDAASAVVHSAVEHSAVLPRGARGARGGRPRSRVDRLGRVDAGRRAPRAPARRRSASSPSRPPTTRSAPSSRSAELRAARRRPAVHRRLRLDGPAAPARRLGGGRGLGAQVGRPGGRRRAAGPQGRPLAQPLPRRRPGRRAVDRASRTSPRRWPPPPRCRRWSPSATRSTPASTRSSTSDPRRVAAEVPDVEVVGDPDRRLPHLVTFSCLYVDGEALVTELDRRGFGVASGSACTASTLTPEPRAGGDGRAHPRQRPALAAARHHPRATSTRFCDVLPGVVARDPGAGGPVTRRPAGRSTSSSTAAAMRCPMPVIELARHLGDVEVGELLAVVARRPGGAVDVPAWCRMRARSTSARTPPTTGARATSYATRLQPDVESLTRSGAGGCCRCGSTSAAASAP